MTPLLFALLVAIGTSILVVSLMLVSGRGRIELGAIHFAILKAVVVVIAVQLVSLIPVAGIFLALPVWWFGLMVLFRVDFWECRIPVLVNWILNVVILLFAWGLIAIYRAEAAQGIQS